MSESDKESLRQSFANLRKALPEGITEADADAIEDLALRLMDRGLPRPAVFAHDDDGYHEVSVKFCVQYGCLVLLADGDHQGYVFAAANGKPICVPPIEFVTWPEAKSDSFIDTLFETWTKVVEVAGEAKVNP